MRFSPKIRMALRLLTIGTPQVKAAHEAGLSPEHLCRVIQRPEAQKELTRLGMVLDDEYAKLFGKVVEVLRESLEHPDPDVRLNAVNLWFKGSGKQQANINVKLSAEDVIAKLLHDSSIIPTVKELTDDEF